MIKKKEMNEQIFILIFTSTRISSFFFTNYERTLSAYFQFAQMNLARATLVLIRVLRTLINSIAKNLHKLQICLSFYSFYKKNSIFNLINSEQKLNKPTEKRREIQAGRRNAAAAREFLFFAM